MSQEHLQVNISKRALYGLGCVVLGGLLMSIGVSYADNLRNTQTVLGTDLILPYDGYMMIDSAPLTGSRTIKFELFEASSGGSAVWTEEQPVQLYNGRFSVGLGTSTSLTATILDAEKLWLAMTIVDSSSGARVEIGLSGRQAIEPAPFAAWSGNSADFNVAGTLAVQQNANVTGTMTAGTLDGPLKPSYDSWDGSDTGSGGAAIINDNNTFNALMIVGNTSSGDPSRKVNLYDDVFINDGLQVNGSTTLGNSTSDTTSVFGSLSVGATASVTGDLNANGNTTLGNASSDATKINGTLEVTQSLTLGDDQDIYGVDIIQGHNDLRLESSPSSGNSVTITDTAITLNEPTTVNGNLTVTGRTTIDCPGSPYIEQAVQHTSGETRLCVYQESVGRTWSSAIANCWDNNYGADLCSHSEMTLLTKIWGRHGKSLGDDHWMRDSHSNDRAFYMNRTVNSGADGDINNIDGDASNTAHLKSSYCCLKVSIHH